MEHALCGGDIYSANAWIQNSELAYSRTQDIHWQTYGKDPTLKQVKGSSFTVEDQITPSQGRLPGSKARIQFTSNLIKRVYFHKHRRTTGQKVSKRQLDVARGRHTTAITELLTTLSSTSPFYVNIKNDEYKTIQPIKITGTYTTNTIIQPIQPIQKLPPVLA